MKMFLEISLLIITVVVIGYLFFYFAGTLLAPATSQNSQNQVCFGSKCFFVEIAKTNAERDRGLMYRTQLDKDKGMLFIFNKVGIYPFWMKDTLIPLDIVWLDSNSMVVFISQNVQPCLASRDLAKPDNSLICPSIVPTAKARYVLEVNAGICQGIGLKVGDKLDLNINQD